MERENGDKALRVLSMYQKLMNNQIVNKEKAAAYGVNSRTIQRDIDDIRGFLETTDSAGISKQIVYDQKERGYRLKEVWSVPVVFEEQRIPQRKAFCRYSGINHDISCIRICRRNDSIAGQGWKTSSFSGTEQVKLLVDS